MSMIQFPVIDPVATGANICRLRKDRGLTVRDLQLYFGFEEPQAIYKWQRGQSLPSVDNLYALSALLHAAQVFLWGHFLRYSGHGRISKPLRSLSACTHRPAAVLPDGRSPWVNKRLYK